jgi:methyl-accepting chemotaxis protein
VAKATAAQEAIRAHLGGLLEILGRTNTSLEEMVFSSNEVVNGIQNLSRAAEETAASTNEMDVSMAQVQSQANASSELSAKVSQEAELGVTAIKQTVQGIDQIKVNNRLAAEVIERLSQCIEEVSTVLGVIDDVAEQTNLLALNAAIIAAQAGDHGRGFAVVADEIKALAERTGASTKEISDIILRIQEHSRRVTDVVTTGVQDVEAGMQLGQHAQDALHSVVSSAQHSMVMMRGIAQATVEHAKGAKKINSAMGQITETMAQIYYATSEQARGSEVLMGNMATMQKTLEEAQVELGLQAEGHATLAQLCQVLGDKGAAMGTLLGDLAPHQPALGQVRAAAQAGQTLHYRAQELSTLLTDRPKTLRP